jgi:hypothetical protein
MTAAVAMAALTTMVGPVSRLRHREVHRPASPPRHIEAHGPAIRAAASPA